MPSDKFATARTPGIQLKRELERDVRQQRRHRDDHGDDDGDGDGHGVVSRLLAATLRSLLLSPGDPRGEGVGAKHLQRIELAKENVSFATLVALSAGYGLPLRDLFDGD